MNKYTVWTSDLGDYEKDPELNDNWCVIYLASDVEKLQAELADNNEALAACQSQAAGRIADLEKALRERIANCHCIGDQYGSPGRCAQCKSDSSLMVSE